MSDVKTDDTLKNTASLLSGERLLAAVQGTLIGTTKKPADICFTSVATDSRNVVSGSLFVPLIGENQDGHRYIPQGIEKGASLVFVCRENYKKDAALYEKMAADHSSVAFVTVENTLHALQAAAAAYVERFPNLIRCAVTGSSGKTTTKEIAVAVLSRKFKVISNKGNLNSETGLPLSVFEIRDEHELGLFEMGMNRKNEIGEIAAVLKPEYGIVTNIGTAHIGILGSRQAIAEEKKKVFTYVSEKGCAVIPAADDFADFLAEGVRGKIVRYGKDVKDSGICFIRDEGLDGTVFSVDGVEMRLGLPGTYNFINALGAVSLARELGVSPQEIKAGIESVKPLGARSHLIKDRLNILEDCYNANPDSMTKAVEFCADLAVSGKKIFVLVDMLELGQESESAHAKIGSLVAESDVDKVIFVGNEMKSACKAAEKIAGKIEYIASHDDEAMKTVAEKIRAFASDGDFVLLKASNGIGLNRLVPLLCDGQGVKK